MNATQDQLQPSTIFQRHRGYFIILVILIVLSLFTITRSAAGNWEISFAMQELSIVLAFLFVLPLLPIFFEGLKKWALKTPFFEFSAENKEQVDQEINENVDVYMASGEAPKVQGTLAPELETEAQMRDQQLAKMIEPASEPMVHKVYFGELLDLVKLFNRNRRKRELAKAPQKQQVVSEGDKLAYQMRALAPLLPPDFAAVEWLQDPNLGKRLAATKYLDWAQDITFLPVLLDVLEESDRKKDTFLAYHILLAIAKMSDQLAYDLRKEVHSRLESYTPLTHKGVEASSRGSLRETILRQTT